jgi:hypothetical protein
MFEGTDPSVQERKRFLQTLQNLPMQNSYTVITETLIV